MSPEIRFYNTLTRQLQVFEPLDPFRVKLYVCGPTVYDEAHLGHARCYVTWDTLVRYMRFIGYEVDYVRNVTDVDDKIIKRAFENGESPSTLATRFTQRFHEVMGRLNVLRPTHEPRATDYIRQMIGMIERLVAQGSAYVTASEAVYYDTTKHSDYGALVNQSLDGLQSGARVDVDPEKLNPLDFVLWKPAKENENTQDETFWLAPWAPGRPGWHIECSAMAHHLLGDQIDLHAGGMDLIFPHHQNEIAQTEAFTGKKPFVNTWMHNGFVNVSGEKMSKSLGNFATLAGLLDQYDANTLRWFILTQHYRSPMDFNDIALAGAKNRVQKIATNIPDLIQAIGFPAEALADAARAHVRALINNPGEAGLKWEKAAMDWSNAMADDLNTAQALAALNELLSLANPKPGEAAQSLTVLEPTALGAFLALSEILGLDFISSTADRNFAALVGPLREMIASLTPDDHAWEGHSDWTASRLIERVLDIRATAKANKDWALSDTIRDRLLAVGIGLKDRKEGLPLWTYDPVVPV